MPGNFHVSTHSVDVQPDSYDFSHEIHEISFGSKIKKISQKGIGTFNSLGGRSKPDSSGLESHEYVMKIVPTTYEDLGGTKMVAYQYTYAYRSYISFGHGGRVVPAIWFRYDLNPITVKYHETRPPLYHFLTTVCAIVGGTFTVAGIIDSVRSFCKFVSCKHDFVLFLFSASSPVWKSSRNSNLESSVNHREKSRLELLKTSCEIVIRNRRRRPPPFPCNDDLNGGLKETIFSNVVTSNEILN